MILAIQRCRKYVEEVPRRTDRAMAAILAQRESDARTRMLGFRQPSAAVATPFPIGNGRGVQDTDYPRFEDIPSAQMRACWVKHFTMVLLGDVSVNAISDNIVQLCMAWGDAQGDSGVAADDSAVTK